MMTSAIPRLAAMVGAAALVATIALPAHASSQPSADIRSSHVAPQTLAPTAAGASAVIREHYVVAAKAKSSVAATAIAPARTTLTGFAASNTNRLGTVTAPAQLYSGTALLQYASQFVGVVPYGMGNTPTTSFSCDGFTQYVFAGFGIALPRGADHQAELGVRIAKGSAVAGDLVWWPGQHIGIYDGAGGMYNSPTWGRYVEHAAELWGSPVFIRLR